MTCRFAAGKNKDASRVNPIFTIKTRIWGLSNCLEKNIYSVSFLERRKHTYCLLISDINFAISLILMYSLYMLQDEILDETNTSKWSVNGRTGVAGATYSSWSKFEPSLWIHLTFKRTHRVYQKVYKSLNISVWGEAKRRRCRQNPKICRITYVLLSNLNIS